MRKVTGLIIISLMLVFGLNSVQAQYENTSGQKKEQKEAPKKKVKKQQMPTRWFVGGMIGAGFSSYSSYVELAPIFGYKITPALHVGTRITYIWNSYQYQTGPYATERVNLHHYGASLFARYIIFKGLFGQVEYEALSFDYYNDQREWINSLFIGGGYFQDIGGRAFMSFAILFNVLDNIDSPYTNPIFRIGFGAGF